MQLQTVISKHTPVLTASVSLLVLQKFLSMEVLSGCEAAVVVCGLLDDRKFMIKSRDWHLHV